MVKENKKSIVKKIDSLIFLYLGSIFSTTLTKNSQCNDTMIRFIGTLPSFLPIQISPDSLDRTIPPTKITIAEKYKTTGYKNF